MFSSLVQPVTKNQMTAKVFYVTLIRKEKRTAWPLLELKQQQETSADILSLVFGF